MKRLLSALPVLVLAAVLATPTLCVPALANDFITPSPVPSSRNQARNTAKTKQKPVTFNNLQTSNKIVKTTKKTGQQPTVVTTPAQ